MAKIIKFSHTFKKMYQKLPSQIQKKVDKQLEFLVCNPRHPSLKIHLIKGAKNIWEGYVDDFHRFTFEIREDHYYLRLGGSCGIVNKEVKR